MKRLVKYIPLAATILVSAFCFAFGNANGGRILELPQERIEQVRKDGEYNSWSDVAAYISKYNGELPRNFITKAQARAMGWSGGHLEPFAPGKSIGGDRFGNYERRLPALKKDFYKECDIDTKGRSRGTKRLVFMSNGQRIYYTEDHYATFMEIKARKGDTK